MRGFLLAACLALAMHAPCSACAKDLPQVPDDKLTPGVTLNVPLEVLCVAGYTATVRHVTEATKRKVYAEYGIGDPDGEQGRFEVDHRVPLEVGGSNDIHNLWPQSLETTPFNAHMKDKLENFARREVCLQRMTLRDAQAIFLGDWRVAYRTKYGAMQK